METQINQWKQEHGAIKRVWIQENKEATKVQVIFKPITFPVLLAFMAKEKQNNEIEGIQLLYNSCVLYADEIIQKNDMLKMVAVKQYMLLFQDAITTLENL